VPRSDGSAGPFTLESLPTPGLNDGNRLAIAPVLDAYARLMNIDARFGAVDEFTISCGAKAFLSGGTRIENAWLPERGRLRLMIAGGADAARTSLRAYQAAPASPAELRMLGTGVQLPLLGPVLHDVEMLHSLMPLVLELTDAQGATCALALLPFPSLLPGGLHNAELRALQSDPIPMDNFWSLSDALLQEALGRPGYTDRSVVGIAVNGASERSNHPIAQAAMQEWLAAVFGLSERKVAEQGLELLIPPESVPTISALVSRRLDAGEGAAMSGPYLVAETDSHRPRWAVSLPVGTDAGNSVPMLRKFGADPVLPAKVAPIPLTIAFRSPADVRSHGVSHSASCSSAPLTVVLEGVHGAERLIQEFKSVVNGEIEWLVRLDDPRPDVIAGLDRACGIGAWSKVATNLELRQVAANARHPVLVTISDRIQLGDGRSLLALLDLLESDETVGSASCALLAEKIIKKEIVLQPASAGLFPSRVSLVSGPRLVFGEPNALQALPDLTYPVVANTMHFTAWRRRALVELPAVSGRGAAPAEDIRIGLDLLRAGYRNWCTTSVRARFSGPYVSRDAIDPLGPGYLEIDPWEDILRKVAILRELF
jgi:hypothetical protein